MTQSETHNHPPSLAPVHLSFGLITHPSRAGWPVHGCFVLENPVRQHGDLVIQKGDQKIVTRDIFSVDSARKLIKEFLDSGNISDGDQAAELEQQVMATGLPEAETRFDRIAQHFQKGEIYDRTISILSGVLPPASDEPPRFEPCLKGELCGSEYCERLPEHSTLVFPELGGNFGPLFFSKKGAKQVLASCVENGLLLPEAANKLEAITARLCDLPEAEQADRLAATLPDEYLAFQLELVFGFKECRPPELRACGDHYHLKCEGRFEASLPFKNVFDANITIKTLAETGLLSESEQAKLLDDLAALNLPPGSEAESIYDPRNMLRHVVDSISNVLNMMIRQPSSR